MTSSGPSLNAIATIIKKLFRPLIHVQFRDCLAGDINPHFKCYQVSSTSLNPLNNNNSKKRTIKVHIVVKLLVLHINVLLTHLCHQMIHS